MWKVSFIVMNPQRITTNPQLYKIFSLFKLIVLVLWNTTLMFCFSLTAASVFSSLINPLYSQHQIEENFSNELVKSYRASYFP